MKNEYQALDDVGCHDGRMDQPTTAGGDGCHTAYYYNSGLIFAKHPKSVRSKIEVSSPFGMTYGRLTSTTITEINHG
jgi:hypothetical protein